MRPGSARRQTGSPEAEQGRRSTEARGDAPPIGQGGQRAGFNSGGSEVSPKHSRNARMTGASRPRVFFSSPDRPGRFRPRSPPPAMPSVFLGLRLRNNRSTQRGVGREHTEIGNQVLPRRRDQGAQPLDENERGEDQSPRSVVVGVPGTPPAATRATIPPSPVSTTSKATHASRWERWTWELTSITTIFTTWAMSVLAPPST